MIAIIDLKIGNIGSIANCLKKCGHNSTIVTNYRELKTATKIILPGVGHFGYAMDRVRKAELDKGIQDAYHQGKHILGICLGMQLLGNYSEEGDCKGLGLIPGKVVKFNQKNKRLPHMGWNFAIIKQKNSLFKRLNEFEVLKFYFVHNYHFVCEDSSDIFMLTDFYGSFNSGINRKTIFGVQFHPEKSHMFGGAFLNDFATIS